MNIKGKGIIALEGMKFFAYHGFYEAERENGNHFEIDLYVQTELLGAGQSDELTETVNYELLYKVVENVMGGRYRLLEHIAWHILETIGREFRSISHAKVRVTKLLPPIAGDIEKVSVEIESSDV